MLDAAPLSMIEVMRQVAGGQVKITPDILIQGGAGAESGSSNVLSAFIASLMAGNLKGLPPAEPIAISPALPVKS